MLSCCCAAEDKDESVAVVNALPTVTDEYPRQEAPQEDAKILQQEAQDKVFTAVFERASTEPLGLKVDSADDKVLHVFQVEEGNNPIARYNTKAPKSKQIAPGVYVLSVKEVSQTGATPQDVSQQKSSSPTTVRAVCSLPHLFDCKVEKKQQKLGLDFTYSHGGICLLISSITAGAVQGATPEVKVGDRIVAVDSVDGSQVGPHELLHAIRDSGDTVVLKISRPCAMP